MAFHGRERQEYRGMKRELSGEVVSFNRRDFLRGGSLASIMAMLGVSNARGQEEQKQNSEPAPEEEKRPIGPPISCGVIGCGPQGRDIITALGRLPNAPVVAVCDKYPAFLKRGKNAAPKAEAFDDYKKVIESNAVQAVFVATPTHQHREIVEAALQAGKHVYCEAPLAHTIEEARAIAKAAKAALKQNFQAGLQFRSDPQHHYVLSQFIRAGATGRFVGARAQWHKKQSWRRASPDSAREKEINWRLSKQISTGLMGEIGIHQMDAVSWFFNTRPTAVSGAGSMTLWSDGRDVPDTIEAIFEYPGGMLFSYGCSLATSFDSDYEIIYGSDSTVLLRGDKGWLFKEVDSPLLGWEVYARKEQIGRETGIVLRADATKLQARGQEEDDASAGDPLAILGFALEAFIANCAIVGGGAADFAANYGDDPAGLKEYIAGLEKDKLPAAGYKQGFEAAVTAIKANEAIVGKKRIVMEDGWFQI